MTSQDSTLWWHWPSFPVPEKLVDLCEFEPRPVYITSSRLARVTLCDPVAKQDTQPPIRNQNVGPQRRFCQKPEWTCIFQESGGSLGFNLSNWFSLKSSEMGVSIMSAPFRLACEGLSWLLIDTGRPSPLWAAPSLGRRCRSVQEN